MRAASFIIAALVFLGLFACRKEVEVDVPDIEEKYVVEGRIEQGRPPIVILTRTQPYFGETDRSAYEERFVHGAKVIVSNDHKQVQLREICSSQVPDSLLGTFAGISGLSSKTLQEVDLCIYSTQKLFGKAGRHYKLRIEVDDDLILSRTGIPHPVGLDSTWFDQYGSNEKEGFAWGIIDDPDTAGNAYRWSAKRIQKGADGEPVDRSYIAPIGSVLEDRFFNGERFEMNYPRGQTPVEREPGEEETILYEVGDTIAVKFASIQQQVFRFYRTFEEAQLSAGSPFAQPTAIKSNVQGALGVWGGFGTSYDTIVAKK